MSSPLEVINLKKTYLRGAHPVEALKGVSFTVKPGEIFGLLGPNGAGKTTLISTVTTLEKPTDGDVKVFGQSVLTSPREAKMQIGVVPQEVVSSGFFNLTEILTYHSGYYGLKDNAKRIAELMERLKLKDHNAKMMRQLSGGMKRRMMIAKALVHRPKLLLLDEPTAGVDVELRTQLWNFVRTLREEGVSVVLTTHYLEEAQMLCDRVGIINHGELKYIGDTAAIIKELTQKKVSVRLTNGQTWNLTLNATDELGKILQDKGIETRDIADIQAREGTLEEAFLKVLEK